MKLKKFLVSTLSVAALSTALATGASALTFGNIPGGTATNDGLVPIYGAGTTSRDGWYGANLWLVGGGGTASITVDYLGAEAGYQNKFLFGGNTIFTTPGGRSVWPGPGDGSSTPPAPGPASVTFNNVADGLLNFAFVAGDGSSTTAQNGSNPDDSGGTSSVNFFATVVANPAGLSGVAWDLWFDDGGAGNDDNHDDMAIRISVTGGTISQVPVPAAGLLLLTALGGLGIARRRRKAA